MIDFNGLKSDVLGAEKAFERMRGISWGARALACAILKLPESWLVNWEFFAKDFNISARSIYRYRDELTQKGIWKIDGKNIIFSDNLSILDNLSYSSREIKPDNLSSVKPDNLSILDNLSSYKKEQSVDLNKKKKEKKENACVREFENDKNQSENSAQNENAQNNFALSARNCVNFTENQGEINEQESQVRGEFNAWGGENLTNDKIFEPKNSGGGENSWAANGTRNTDNGTRTDEKDETQNAASNANFARVEPQGTARAFGGEVVLNSAGQMPKAQNGKLNTAAAIADYLTQKAKTAQISQNECETGQGSQNSKNGEIHALNGTRTDTQTQGRGMVITKMENATQSEIHAAQKTPKKQRQTAQTPEQTAAAMLEKHGEIAKSANFSESEREAVLDYFAYKAEHKKYLLTERNSKAILKQCVKIKGENKDLPEIIERTIANGWADLRWVADKPAQNAYKSAWQQQQEQKQASWKAIIEKYRPKNEQKQAQKAV